MNNSESDSRNHELDQMRLLLILFMVLLHTLLAYTGIFPVWPVVDSPEGVWSRNIDMLTLIIDGFLMPPLFLLAGHYCISSLARHGSRFFLIKKFWRIAIPWLFYVLLVPAYIRYVYWCFRGQQVCDLNYFDSVVLYIQSFLSLKTGMIIDINYLKHTSFNQSVYWFLSLLMIFYVIAALLYPKLEKLMVDDKNDDSPAFQVSIIGFFIVLSALGYAFLMLFKPGDLVVEPWVMVASVIQIQLPRLPVYVLFFILGSVAFIRGWNGFRLIPLAWPMWALASIISGVLFIKSFLVMIADFNVYTVMLSATSRIAFCVCMFIFAIKLLKSLNLSRLKFMRVLTDYSYWFYLLHIVPVVFFQWYFHAYAFNTVFKIVLVYSLSLTVSFCVAVCARTLIDRINARFRLFDV